MKIKNDDVLVHLRSFGFTCEEHTSEGFVRYAKRIGNLVITIANGQFENKIRISMLQDHEGKIRTSYKDVLAYTDLIGALCEAGLVGEGLDQEVFLKEPELDLLDNPLIGFPRKPEGFMVQ